MWDLWFRLFGGVGSTGLVMRISIEAIIRVMILITPMTVTLLTKFHDPQSRVCRIIGLRYSEYRVWASSGIEPICVCTAALSVSQPSDP